MINIDTTMRSAHPKLAVLIVSYGNPTDVDRCLRSLARSDFENFEVFICENAGTQALACLLGISTGPNGILEQVDHHCSPLDEPARRFVSVRKCRLKERLNIVRVGQAESNLGYGGGVNAWLERLLEVHDWEAVLVLNPDTEVHESCLSELMTRAAQGFGMIGGSLVFDDAPDRIINYGLRWSPITGRITAVGRNLLAGTSPSPELLSRIDSVSGACVLVTRAFVEDVGPMAEDYFLYMEDVDWGRRRGRHKIGLAERAIIRHVGGTAIGSAVDPKRRSFLSIYLSARNSVLYARRWAGRRWVLHFGWGLLHAIRYGATGAPLAAKVTVTGLIDGARGKTGRPDATVRLPEAQITEFIILYRSAASIGDTSPRISPMFG
ncbi:N-acetylglucosaminyl-diphospho-decaprenol L-rhamnosyltransferase [Bradyrhizobium sp. LM2.7]